jgi:hypothetical protein
MTHESMDDPDLVELYAYWNERRGTRAMPCRADIRPSDVRGLLPHIFIADIFEPLSIKFRLVGSAICARWGINPTGRCLDELDLDGERTRVQEQFGSVVRTGEPRYDIEEFVNDHGRYLHYRRLLLPLSDDGSKPNMLLGMQKAIGMDGYKVKFHRWV